jgi:hypothetical protein
MTASGTEVDSEWDGSTPDETGVYHAFVAFGFVGAEVGIVLGSLPVAVVGLLLLGWSLVGVLVEAGVLAARHRPTALAVVALAYLALGVGVHSLAGGVGVGPRGLALWAASAGLLVRVAPIFASDDRTAS